MQRKAPARKPVADSPRTADLLGPAFIVSAERVLSDDELRARVADLTAEEKSRLGRLLSREAATGQKRTPGRKPGAFSVEYIAHIHGATLSALQDGVREGVGDVQRRIIAALERPVIITAGDLAGRSVAGVARGSPDVRVEIESAVRRAWSVMREDSAAHYVGTPRGIGALAKAITLAILAARGKPVSDRHLDRVLRKAGKPTATASET